ncbi:hypothetical protein CPR19088_GLDEOEPO_00838 [Companilactobacillus paralimentarius]
MKITSKSVSIIAALAMATTGVLAFNVNNADAATVATVHSGVVARLYASNGNLITNRALSPNSAWAVGKTATINGETMYQVATNEYLRAQDSSLAGQAQQSSTKIAGKATTLLPLFRDDTNKMADRSLAPNSEWAIGKYIVNKNGQQFVQVSTHEYADASNLMYDHPMTNPTYIADFGINTHFSVVGSMNMGNGWGTGDSSSDTNQGGVTTTTPSQPSTSTDTSVSSNDKNQPVASTEAIQQAILKSINDERASKGTAPVVLDSTLTNIAMKRAHESVTNFSHIRADGNHWYAELKQVAPSYIARGENLSLDPWDDLETQTATHLADHIMEMFKGEGEGSATNWTHYTGILDSKANKVGIGVYVTPDNTVYTAEDFAG